jgi:hypothetical protein
LRYRRSPFSISAISTIPFLDLARFYHDFPPKIHIPFCDLSHAGFWGLEELRMVDDASFYNLCESTFEFFSGRVCNAVHPRQDRGWNLHVRDAAYVCGSDEADNIAHAPPPCAIRAEVRSAPMAMSFSITSRQA